jgi:hypothetical protein
LPSSASAEHARPRKSILCFRCFGFFCCSSNRSEGGPAPMHVHARVGTDPFSCRNCGRPGCSNIALPTHTSHRQRPSRQALLEDDHALPERTSRCGEGEQSWVRLRCHQSADCHGPTGRWTWRLLFLQLPRVGCIMSNRFNIKPATSMPCGGSRRKNLFAALASQGEGYHARCACPAPLFSRGRGLMPAVLCGGLGCAALGARLSGCSASSRRRERNVC